MAPLPSDPLSRDPDPVQESEVCEMSTDALAEWIQGNKGENIRGGGKSVGSSKPNRLAKSGGPKKSFMKGYKGH